MSKGLYIQLANRSTSKIVFSACTDEMSREAFQTLWKTVGETIYSGLSATNVDAFKNYYELQISPITN